MDTTRLPVFPVHRLPPPEPAPDPAPGQGPATRRSRWWIAAAGVIYLGQLAAIFAWVVSR